MYRFIAHIMIFAVLNGCLSHKSKSEFSIFEENDFEKSCLQLFQDLEKAKNQLDKLSNKKQIDSAKNLAFYMAAIPTAFASLLFLKSDDDIDHDLFIVKRRIENIEDLLTIKTCNKDMLF